MAKVWIAHIGDHMLPGVEDAVLASAPGNEVTVWLQKDLCVLPFQGTGAMRNNSIMAGLELGAEWIVLLDNDTLLTPGCISQMMLHDKPAVIPYFNQHLLLKPTVSDNAEMWRLTEPIWNPNQGLKRLLWGMSSCQLFRRDAFNLIGLRPYTDPLIIGEDEYNWRCWSLQGLELWQDTDVHVTLLRPPGPVAQLPKSWQKLLSRECAGGNTKSQST